MSRHREVVKVVCPSGVPIKSWTVGYLVCASCEGVLDNYHMVTQRELAGLKTTSFG